MQLLPPAGHHLARCPEGPIYTRAPGVLLQELGSAWAAYSAIAGSSHLLNNSGAAVLDVLAESGPSSGDEVAVVLSEEVGVPLEEVMASLAEVWAQLEQAGLVRVAWAGARS